MKAIISFFLSTSLIVFMFSSCQKEYFNQEPQLETEAIAYPNVPAELWDYFKKFEDEARLRGVNIDLAVENITAEISEIEEKNVAGTCTYGSHSPGHIVIDLEFFNQVSDLFKEMIIFHELGHCSLHRGHREDTYTDGTCVSIMRSGLSGCHDNYRTNTRATYLDELFSAEFLP